jgi:hypothetical protein
MYCSDEKAVESLYAPNLSTQVHSLVLEIIRDYLGF